MRCIAFTLLPPCFLVFVEPNMFQLLQLANLTHFCINIAVQHVFTKDMLSLFIASIIASVSLLARTYQNLALGSQGEDTDLTLTHEVTSTIILVLAYCLVFVTFLLFLA